MRPQPTRPDLRAACSVIVGIDAGGSSTRVRAVKCGQVIYEGTGGPGNPLAATAETLEASYRAALAGCPEPTQVGACVAGAGAPAQRSRITDLLTRYFPDAVVRVFPDYVAAFLSAPPDTDVCVIAGTGSVVCSKIPDGTYAVSGGRGWILGDHGSAARLGQAVLEEFVDDPEALPQSFAAAIEKFFGDGSCRFIINMVNSAPNPAQILARAAPLLTAAAEDGMHWAAARLDTEMTALAGTATRHIDRYVHESMPVRIALSGGVWASHAAESSFATAVERLSKRQVVVTKSPSDPIEGAIRLAGSDSK